MAHPGSAPGSEDAPPGESVAYATPSHAPGGVAAASSQQMQVLMTPAYSPQSPFPVSAMMHGGVGAVSGPMGGVPHSGIGGGYTPGSLLNTFGSPSPFAGGYGYSGLSGAAPTQLPWLQSLHATVGSVGALAELVGMTAEAAKHFGGSWLSLLEQAGQTAGEVAGVLDPRPPADPETGEDLCSAEEHLTAQRRRAARWLLGAALVSGLLVAGRFVAAQLASPSGRGLRIVLLLAAGAAVGFSRPRWVEERSAAVASYLLQLFDGLTGSSDGVAPPPGAAERGTAERGAAERGAAERGTAEQGTAEHTAPLQARQPEAQGTSPGLDPARSPLPATPLSARSGAFPAETRASGVSRSFAIAPPRQAAAAAQALQSDRASRLEPAGAPVEAVPQASPVAGTPGSGMAPAELRRRRLEALRRR